jgi:hypothetical protein
VRAIEDDDVEARLREKVRCRGSGWPAADDQDLCVTHRKVLNGGKSELPIEDGTDALMSQMKNEKHNGLGELQKPLARESSLPILRCCAVLQSSVPSAHL